MAEYIDKKMAIYSIESSWCMHCEKSNGVLCDECEHNIDIVILDGIPAADVQPVRKWVNDKILSPSVDGDYLVFYRGFFHVFERFKGKWYDEDRCDVITDLDKLWWQELPPMPEAIKG